MEFHSTDFNQVLNELGTNPDLGLDENKVEDSKKKFGTNELSAYKTKSSIMLLLEQFNNPVIYILIVAAVLNGILADLKDAIVIGAVVILNTFLGFFQEKKASNALKA